MLPIEVEIQSLRVLVKTKVLEEDWIKERYEQLALIDERRARAQYHTQGYQKRIARAFNKKVKPRNLKEGDLVLKVLRDETFDLRGKMKSGWSGPFIFEKIMLRGAMRITDLDRGRDASPSTWIGSESITFDKEKKPARLKTRKGGKVA